NDDGIEAEGLQVLRAALSQLPDVRLAVIAPDGNRSAMARSITTRRPLVVAELVVAGINHGANLGDDITYSGTVAAALEGVVLGLPAIAVSQQSGAGSLDYRFDGGFA